MNFNEVFRKLVTYDNIESKKKTGLHPFFEKRIFGKTSGGSAVLRLTKLKHSIAESFRLFYPVFNYKLLIFSLFFSIKDYS